MGILTYICGEKNKMSRPLLYRLLEKLDKSELRELKKLVRSPVATHRPELALLYAPLSAALYQGKPLPDKPSLYALVFGADEPYHDQRLRSLMSDLHALLENHLMARAACTDPVQAHIQLARFYRQRGLTRHFELAIQKALALHEKSPYRNVAYFERQLSLQIELSQFESTDQRADRLNLQEISDTMDVLYLAQKVRHACSQLSHRAVYQTDYQFGLLQTWIDVLEDGPYLRIPAIALYYYCYRFLTEAYSHTYFAQFRDQLRQHGSSFPKEELKDLYRAAINFCIRKLNEGSLDLAHEGWELYQEGLQSGLFIEHNHLSRFTFDNIVGFGLRLEEFAAVQRFIEQYQTFLAADYAESTVLFNLARLEYGLKNYDLALLHLQQANPRDLVNQLICKTLQLKIYYESHELNLLESHLDSFRIFIRRREVSDYHRQNFQNVITYTRRLIGLYPHDAAERQRLRTAIQEEQILSEREWLLSKV